MNKNIQSYITNILFLLLLFANTGCTSFIFPKHSNSLQKNGEQVVIEMIDRDMIFVEGTDRLLPDDENKKFSAKSFKENYEAVFGKNSLKDASTSSLASLAATGIAYGADLLIEYIKEKLEEEAKLYRDQFQNRAVFSGFWQKDGQNFKAKYLGFKITRFINVDIGSVFEEIVEKQAFTLVCGLHLNKDNMFEVAPLSFQTNFAKAKILSSRWWTYPFWGWNLDDHEEIKTVVDVEIDAVWRNTDQEQQITKLAAFAIPLPHHKFGEKYQTNKPASEPEKFKVLRPQKFGVFSGIPKSHDLEAAVAEFGTFSLKLRATEEDTSNAKKYIEKGIDAINKNKAKIVEKIFEKSKKELEGLKVLQSLEKLLDKEALKKNIAKLTKKAKETLSIGLDATGLSDAQKNDIKEKVQVFFNRGELMEKFKSVEEKLIELTNKKFGKEVADKLKEVLQKEVLKNIEEAIN